MKTLPALLMALFSLNHALAADRPNIVLVMADDQGWGDTGYNGHPVLKTPHLDALAAEGLRLNRFYTAHFNCSPTRASVLTGRHPARMGTFAPGSPIRAEELTVAKVLQSAGYATGHFGKWHLNGKNGNRDTKTVPGRAILADDPLSPGKMGFDEWLSADNFFDLDPVLGRNGVPEKFKGDGSDITMDLALAFIRKQVAEKKPFFTVAWFGNPHVPHEALPADKAGYAALGTKDQNYYGEITGVDRNVGKLRAALRELNVSGNTLVWYCSDNGGKEGPNSTGHLRGQKGTLWEGGLRVPGLIEWPARIPKAFTSDVPCSTLDMFPTLLAATGLENQATIAPLDGINLLPLLDGKLNERGKAIPFWAHKGNGGGHAALLEWPYKLHLNAARGGPQKGNAPAKDEVPAQAQLYDIAKDPGESTDLAAQQPERVARMTATLKQWQDSVEASLAKKDYAPAAQASP